MLNGSLADLPVKVISKESRETQSRKTTFGQKRSALALSREEVARKLLIRDNQGFAAQRTALGAADAEGVGETCVVFKFDVACSKRIGKTRAVDIKKESFFAADLGEFLEFGKAIKRTEFCRVGNVDEPGFHVKDAFGVGAVGNKRLPDSFGRQLAVDSINFKHLVAGGFDGSRFVCGNVAARCRQNTLPGPQNGRNQGEVTNRTARKEEYAGVRTLAGFADFRLSFLAEHVFAVAGHFGEIVAKQSVHDLRRATGDVVALKLIGSSHDLQPQ